MPPASPTGAGCAVKGIRRPLARALVEMHGHDVAWVEKPEKAMKRLSYYVNLFHIFLLLAHIIVIFSPLCIIRGPLREALPAAPRAPRRAEGLQAFAARERRAAEG